MTNERIPIGNNISIYQRGKKKIWVADFWHEDRHRRKSLKTSNKKVATERAVKLANELQDGVYQSTPQLSRIDESIVRYLDQLKTDGRARKTLVRYRGQLETFRDFCESRRVTTLTKISPTLFDDYRAMRSGPLMATTLDHESRTCKQFLKWCESRRLVAESPLKHYKLTKPPRNFRPAPTLQEVQKVFASVSERDQLMLAILVCTGIRSGEMRQLWVEDVDLTGNWIHIVSREETPTKTHASRKIPIHDSLKPFLEKQMASKPIDWFINSEASRRYPNGDHWINTKRLNERFVRKLEKLELPAGRKDNGYSIHSLRHFFETHCVNSGIPQRVVDIWMGHSPGKSMSAVYYHLRDEDSQNFMAGLKLCFTSDN